MELFLGVDIGGSRTRALIADSAGRSLGYGEAGAGNHEVVGYDGLRAAVLLAVGGALSETARALSEANPRMVGHDGEERIRAAIRGAGFGVAGYDWPSEEAETREHLEAVLVLSCPMVLRNDAALGLAAGTKDGFGVNLSSGTSNNCYGLWKRDGIEVEGRIAGAGAVVGEEGGALEIATDALRAVNHARIRRSGPTAITELMLERTGFADADALIEAVAAGLLSPDPAWAPLVFLAARAGDAIALGIIDRAGRELGESASAVVRQIGVESEAFDLVLSGSLFSRTPELLRGVEAVLRRVAPHFRAVRLDAPPVIGAVVLGMRDAGLDPAPLLPLMRTSSLRLLAAGAGTKAPRP
jgi:N-acetylglucosamine kinase-like BadF-type ATPase